MQFQGWIDLVAMVYYRATMPGPRNRTELNYLLVVVAKRNRQGDCLVVG